MGFLKYASHRFDVTPETKKAVAEVVADVQPEVAFAMVQLGLAFDDMHTALDLEEGLALLNRKLEDRKPAIGRDAAD